MRYLTFALTKGRLAKKTLEMLESLGITCEEMKDKDARKLIFVNEELKLKFFVAKGPDVPTYVEYGAADIGVVGKDVVEMASEILLIPGICLILTAVLLFIADHAKDGDKLPKGVTYTNAFGVGIAQGIATLPGLSRSGTTITACLLSGFNRNFAVKYSFLMSIPAILGALVLELKDYTAAALSGAEIAYYVVGMIVAAVVGYVCIKTMLIVVRRKKFTGFAIYCLIVGVISIGGYIYMA